MLHLLSLPEPGVGEVAAALMNHPGKMKRLGRRTLIVLCLGGLVLLAGCASRARPRTQPAVPPAPAEAAAPQNARVIFRLQVNLDGRPHPFPADAIHLLRTDLPAVWSPPNLRPVPWAWGKPATGEPLIHSVGPEPEGWYAVSLAPGTYQLNAVSKWHFPTVRAIPPLRLEFPAPAELVYVGSIAVNCRDRLSPDNPGSYWYDCDPPVIRTDDVGTAGRIAGETAGVPAIRAARALSALASPDPATLAGPLAMEAERGGTGSLPLGLFPVMKGAAAQSAIHSGGLVAGTAFCGPFFLICLAVAVPIVAIDAAVAGGVQDHGNHVRLECSERINGELQDFDAEKRLRLALREKFAAAGRPLSEPENAPEANAPTILLRVAVLRIGVRYDTCLPGFNPFKLSDRYRADLLAVVQAVNGMTGELLYEEYLNNTEKLSPWDVVAGRGGVSPAGSASACRRAKEFCPKEGTEVLNRDIEPAIEAFAEHVVRIFVRPVN